MADIPISWKKISRGIPKVRKFADDRAPTIEEIQKTTGYPDRRIKAIICTIGFKWNSCGCLGLLKMEAHCPNRTKWTSYSGEDL